MAKKVRLDEKDIQIIDALYKDARVSLSQLSNITKISITAIRNRLSKLLRHNIVLGFYADINFAKLGYDIHALVGIKVDFENRKDVIGALLSNDRVLNLYEVTGDFDIIVEVIAKGLGDLREFLTTEMYEVPGIKKTETMVILKKYRTHNPFRTK